MKHFCMARSYRNGTVRLLCTKEWVEDVKQKRNGYTSALSAIVSTTMLNVECKDCLKILIPRIEKQIDRLQKLVGKIDETKEVNP